MYALQWLATNLDGKPTDAIEWACKKSGQQTAIAGNKMEINLGNRRRFAWAMPNVQAYGFIQNIYIYIAGTLCNQDN